MNIWQKTLALPFVAVGYCAYLAVVVCALPFLCMSWAAEWMEGK